MVKEDWWHLLKVGSEKVMIDEDTMVIMKDMECEWGYKAKSDVILTCKLTSTIADEDERMKQWNKRYTFSMGVKEDIDSANNVDDLSKQLEHTTISDKDSDSGESSATTESIPATLK